jgi:pyridoxal phosphate enzyme (YggS family)
MHDQINNLVAIEKKIQQKLEGNKGALKIPKIIAVSKTFPISSIMPLINHGHLDFGENKIQEAVEKWVLIKKDFSHIKLHMVGRLQTNKVKSAIKIFDYIHSVDNKKLAIKIANEELKQKKKIKIFIQINIGNEDQKLGIKKEEAFIFYKFCRDLNLDVVGTMCIPPKEGNAESHFLEMNKINKELCLSGLSMGMSEDYLEAAQNNATFLRIGSKIFGQRN